MSQFDPAMSTLFGSMLTPMAAAQSSGIAGVLDEAQKRKKAATLTAKPPQFQAQPVTHGLANAPRDGRVVAHGSSDTPAGFVPPPSAEQQQYSNDQASLMHAKAQIAQAKAGQAPVSGYDPATGLTGGVTLGDQAGGGRNVELIRGTQSSIQHFNEQGDNTTNMPTPAGPSDRAAIYAGVKPEHLPVLQALDRAGVSANQLFQARQHIDSLSAPKAPSFHEANAEDLFNHQNAQHQYDHFDSKMKAIPPSDPEYQNLAAQRDAARQRMNDSATNIHNRQHPPAPGAPTAAPPPVDTTLGGSILRGPQAQALHQELQIPKGNGHKITPDVIARISRLVGNGPGSSQQAEQLARQYGWSL